MGSSIPSEVLGGDSIAIVNLENSDWQGAAIRASEVTVDETSRWLITDDSLVTDPTITVGVTWSGNSPVEEKEELGLGTTRNAGLIEFAAPSPDSSYKTLTTDHYVGEGGTIIFNTHLGSDGSPTDLMHVTENTSGTSSVIVRNTDGLGAQTTGDGIRIIQVDGESDGEFSLVGDYEIEGRQAVIAGAYGYTLWKNGVSDPTDGDWYLRSQLIDGDPLYQPAVPVYETYPQILLGLNGLPT